MSRSRICERTARARCGGRSRRPKPYKASSTSKSFALLHRHILKPVSILSFSLRPRRTNFSPQTLHRIVTLTRSVIMGPPDS